MFHRLEYWLTQGENKSSVAQNPSHFWWERGLSVIPDSEGRACESPEQTGYLD